MLIDTFPIKYVEIRDSGFSLGLICLCGPIILILFLNIFLLKKKQTTFGAATHLSLYCNHDIKVYLYTNKTLFYKQISNLLH